MVRGVRFFVRLALPLLLAAALAVYCTKAQAVTVYLGYSSAVHAVALSPNGRQALSGGGDNVLRLWDVATGLPLRTFDTQTDAINAVAFFPDGRYVLAAGNDGKIRLWEFASGLPAAMLEGHTAAVLSVAFSADGRYLLSGSKDKTVKLWDVVAGQTLKTFEGHSDEVLAVAFSPDGKQALSAGKDKTLRLWDIETGQQIRMFEGHGAEVTSVAFAAGGRVLSGSKDKTLRLWDAATGKLLKTFDAPDEVLSAAVAGGRILASGKDKTLRLWDAESGALLKTYEGHGDAVTSVVFSADGRQALSGSLDKTLKLWDLEAGQAARTVDLQPLAFWPDGHQALGWFGFIPGMSLPATPDPKRLKERLEEKGFKLGSPILLRFFKADAQAELWMKRGQRFELFATYPICAWSGQLGPKLVVGDGQAPEGFYTITKGQLVPNSHYHRAFNTGYPNLFDREHKRTGSALMIHGSCVSAGCYAMTDSGIDDIWALVTAALNAGQENVWVHAFPFRMTEERLAAFDWHPSAEFWRDLKLAYDLFEQTGVPPQISVCNKRYAIRRGSPSANGALISACPPRREKAGPGNAWRAAAE